MKVSPCLLCRFGDWIGFGKWRPFTCLLFTSPVFRCNHFKRRKK